MREIDIIIANPAGNITAFVLNPVERKEYSKIGRFILGNQSLKVEQVAFVKEFLPNPRMEMCGMEFCGNAGRAFGLLCARVDDIHGDAIVGITESGCSHILLVDVNVEKQVAFISMPLPENIIFLEGTGIREIEGSTLVDLGGIMHVVMKDSYVKPSMELFKRIKDYIMKKYNPAAMGVMFVENDKSIVPFVYVKDVDSIYEEGSCASGTTACAIAWSRCENDGELQYLVKQPAGELKAIVRIEDGLATWVSIGGPVEFAETMKLELDI